MFLLSLTVNQTFHITCLSCPYDSFATAFISSKRLVPSLSPPYCLVTMTQMLSRWESSNHLYRNLPAPYSPSSSHPLSWPTLYTRMVGCFCPYWVLEYIIVCQVDIVEAICTVGHPLEGRSSLCMYSGNLMG